MPRNCGKQCPLSQAASATAGRSYSAPLARPVEG